MVHLERIKELCEKKNVTMKQAAIELGMTEQSLHKIIKANSTKIDTLLNMAQYFNVEPAYFFDNYSVADPAAVEEILDLLGLTERRHHLPNQLSGGQQQRVAIGRALITKPKLILADEPTGNLDSKNSQDVMALLTQASRRFQQTILMITHNKNLTASVDRVFRVSDGVLTDLGGKKNEALS